MHQLFSRFDAKSNDPHEQKNHGVGFVSRISLETLQACLLDGFDLLLSDAQTLHVTSKRCDCVGWQSNPLGCSHGDEFLRCFAQHWVEVAHSELDQDRLHPVNRAGSCSDQRFSFPMRASAILFLHGRDDGHAAVTTLTTQPAKKATLQYGRIDPIRLNPPVFTWYGHTGGMDHVGINAASPQPTGEPKTIPSGLIGDRNPGDFLPGLDGFVPPAI